LIGEFVNASAFAVPAPQGLVDRARAFGGFGGYLAMYATTARLTRINQHRLRRDFSLLLKSLLLKGHAPQALRVPAPGC
jgi:hypothetical protein